MGDVSIGVPEPKPTAIYPGTLLLSEVRIHGGYDMYDWQLMDPTVNVWLRVRQAWEALERAIEEELDDLHTTLRQIDTLMLLLSSKRPLTSSEIASCLFRTQHSTSELLSRMETHGYIKRIPRKDDRRAVEVIIEPKGEELLRQALDRGFRYARRIITSSLTLEEMSQLDEPLRKLRDGALNEIGLSAEPLPIDVDREAGDRPF
jgi:DNA-binding MarR family transcriptional regulator